jgi:hypothetical protein
LVRLSNGEVSALNREWLGLSLKRAEEEAGYVSWWLAEHVAESVLWYLASGCDRPVLTAHAIRESVRCALQAIGYSEIAACFETLDPPFELCLADLALEAGPGYELAFFQLLRERIRPALSDQASNVRIHGLQRCVRHLQSVKTWSRECSQLRSEIVTFVRAELESANVQSNFLLTIQ